MTIEAIVAAIREASFASPIPGSLARWVTMGAVEGAFAAHRGVSFRPDPETLRWAAGQVLASGPATPDTTPLYCAQHYIRVAARRLSDHAEYLESHS